MIDLTNFWKPREEFGINTPAKFIVFEGIDGSGKTTQAKLLCNSLSTAGYVAKTTKEPHNPLVKQYLRDLNGREEPEAEERLFRCDRLAHLEEVIVPSLRENQSVVCDRYFYSSVGYRGGKFSTYSPHGIWHLSHLKEDWVFGYCKGLEKERGQLLEPDIVFLLVIDPEKAMQRIYSRPDLFTPYENQEYLEKVHEVYSQIKDPRIVRVNGNRPEKEVAEEIWSYFDGEEKQCEGCGR